MILLEKRNDIFIAPDAYFVRAHIAKKQLRIGLNGCSLGNSCIDINIYVNGNLLAFREILIEVLVDPFSDADHLRASSHHQHLLDSLLAVLILLL